MTNTTNVFRRYSREACGIRGYNRSGELCIDQVRSGDADGTHSALRDRLFNVAYWLSQDAWRQNGS